MALSIDFGLEASGLLSFENNPQPFECATMGIGVLNSTMAQDADVDGWKTTLIGAAACEEGFD